MSWFLGLILLDPREHFWAMVSAFQSPPTHQRARWAGRAQSLGSHCLRLPLSLMGFLRTEAGALRTREADPRGSSSTAVRTGGDRGEVTLWATFFGRVAPVKAVSPSS